MSMLQKDGGIMSYMSIYIKMSRGVWSGRILSSICFSGELAA